MSVHIYGYGSGVYSCNCIAFGNGFNHGTVAVYKVDHVVRRYFFRFRRIGFFFVFRVCYGCFTVLLNKEARFIHCLIELVFIHRLVRIGCPTDITQLYAASTWFDFVFVITVFFRQVGIGFWCDSDVTCVIGLVSVSRLIAVRIVFCIGIAQNCAFFHDRVCRDGFGVFFRIAFLVNLVFRIPFSIVCFDHVDFCTIYYCFRRSIVDR